MNSDGIGNYGDGMRPFALSDVVGLVMKRKSLSFEDAMSYVYSSDMYFLMHEEEAKMWYLSAEALYDRLEKEKASRRRDAEMSERLRLFLVMCIENYSLKRHIYPVEVLTIFNENEVWDFLKENYEVLHTQSLDYIVDTIVKFIKRRNRI